MAKVPASPEGATLTPRQLRYLKISIVIMTVLLIAGIVALVFGMARQASRLGAASRQTTAEAKSPYMNLLDLGRGEIKELTISNGLIIMHWKGEAADTIITFEAVNGHEVGRIQVPKR